MSITSRIDQSQQIATIIVKGKISPIELIKAIDPIYKNTSINYVLWDFRYTDLKALNIFNDLERTTSKLKQKYLNLEKACKTAIVAPIDLWFSFTRIFMTSTEKEKQLHSIQVFRFMDEAIMWFGSESRRRLPQLRRKNMYLSRRSMTY